MGSSLATSRQRPPGSQPSRGGGEGTNERAGPRLTCGEGRGGDAAPGRVPGRLQEHRVVRALRQALQSDPRVLRLHDQLLREEPEEGGRREGWDGGVEAGSDGPSASRASVAVAVALPSSLNKEKVEPIGRGDSPHPRRAWGER